MRSQELKPTFVDLVQQKGVDFGDQSPQAYKIGFNCIERPGCFQGMLGRPFNTAQTENNIFAELHSGLFDDLAGLDLLHGAGPFFYPF